MDLGDYANDMAALAASFPQEASKVVRAMAITALDSLVIATPVDTGRARSNWFASIDQPSVEETTEVNVQANLIHQTNIISKSSKFDTIWLSNNLPYIARLNDGYSGQAPAGFVEKAVVAAEGAIVQSKFMEGV